ncbi:MAG: DUF2189 domain-containing protein [Paracoccaceae bacterium]
MTDATETPEVPEINEIALADIVSSLRAGVRDFKSAPMFGLFFGALFSFVGIVIFLQIFVVGSSYWVLPIAAGFPLIGPFAAIGLYEVSHRMEAGRPLDWAGILRVVADQRRRQVPSMAFVALFFFLVWVYMAHLIFALSFGLKPLTNVMSSADILLTREGITMIAAGTVVGGGLAFLLFAISVVAVPMLLDREIDVVTAMITSFRAVRENKVPMLLWGFTIASLTMIAMIPLFLGMLIIFPVLGHASWHLYRRVIASGQG